MAFFLTTTTTTTTTCTALRQTLRKMATNSSNCRCRMNNNNNNQRFVQSIQRYKSASPTVNAEATTATAITQKAASSTSASTTTQTNSVPIVQSLLAAGAGILTVSAVAGIVESATASDVPKYDPIHGQRYDQSHFTGRFCKMLLGCDPRLLFYTEEQVRSAATMLQQYDDATTKNDSTTSTNTTTNNDRILWEAKRIVDSALNENGEWIPRPFRMSGYVPYNGPICVAMVASTSTVPLLFWSWINQSQNALVNYYNRNSASNLTNETLFKSYGIAVTSALTVAFGLATLIQKKYEPSKAKILLRYVAFPSSVAASSLNCYIVRSPEIQTGIPLLDEDGNNVLPNETSQIAAKQGVYLTTASRAILQAPVFFIPPVLLSTIPVIRRYLSKQPSMTVPVSTYLLLICFGIGLPSAIAIFPQINSVPATNVEEKFQHLRSPKTNQPYETFYYNKGL